VTDRARLLRDVTKGRAALSSVTMGSDQGGDMESGEAYQELRPLLFSIAYRMVGSVSEAEDLVQESFLRFHRAVRAGAQVESTKAYLSAVTTRLAVNHLRSARVRRERYVGTWLPEPLLTDSTDDAAQHAETADSVSMAFLVLLESLSPVERAVFLLREVFGYPYDEIARVVDKTEDNCRQLAARARRHVQARKPRFEASRNKREELARRFLAAVEDGDTEGLVGVLAADAVMYGDGGGKAPAVAKPIHGRQRVARFLLGLGRQARLQGVDLRAATINGQPGVLAFDPRGRVLGALSVDIADGQVQTVRSVVNPDKLRHLGPVGDG
jgi:RNA polymerase sigma-70 factor, ECF subfamily